MTGIEIVANWVEAPSLVCFTSVCVNSSGRAGWCVKDGVAVVFLLSF